MNTEQLLEDYNAFYEEKGTYYCADCATEKLGDGSADMLLYKVQRGHISTIHEDTIQYEQWPGEIIPLEGIYCACCEAELYSPLELE